ncbi:MAG: ribosome small subunit-dependent GTPase A [Ruminococcus sp.]|nr:ribosome small subunit-dependent GTPase A [Ruminococcus sp.]MBO5384113.1 ribosome small subunit-dependent GTPase A [Ruminococcus sp.]
MTVDNKIKTGIITKCLGGLYTIESPDGIYECKARGVFRNKGISPYVGDYVEFSDGVITKISDRKNCIIRPPLANLDRLIFVVSTCKPSPNLLLLDKFIAIAEYKKIEPVIVITKTDLSDYENIMSIYSRIGIKVIAVDYSDSSTIESVKELLKGKISAFTGNSGAGKSTLLNAIDAGLAIPTGEISEKLGRGRHTTRHAELYKICEGYIADTPGFSTFETNKYDIIFKEDLAGCFREFAEYSDDCKFSDCAHICEKGCSVIAAKNDGKISESRHSSYCEMYEEAKKIKEWEL